MPRHYTRSFPEVVPYGLHGGPATRYGVAPSGPGSPAGSISVVEKSRPSNNQGRPRTFASA